MRLVLQRVSRAAVTINRAEQRESGPGLMILAGIAAEDTPTVCDYMAQKAVNLRIFEDENGNMNRSLLEAGGALLLVSQFTLYANSKKGRRPSFTAAAVPEISKPLYETLAEAFRRVGVSVTTGEFGAHMEVELVNDGPVTILLDSAEIMPPVKA